MKSGLLKWPLIFSLLKCFLSVQSSERQNSLWDLYRKARSCCDFVNTSYGCTRVAEQPRHQYCVLRAHTGEVLVPASVSLIIYRLSRWKCISGVSLGLNLSLPAKVYSKITLWNSFTSQSTSTQMGVVLASALWEDCCRIFGKHRQSLASNKPLVQVAVTVGRSRLCTVLGGALPRSCSPLTVYRLMFLTGLWTTCSHNCWWANFFFSFLNDCFHTIIAGRVERLRQRMCDF